MTVIINNGTDHVLRRENTMQSHVLLVGEPMGLLMAKTEGRLEDVTEYSLAVAGAEFNVAVGLVRLNHTVTYVTKLGKDPFGKLISNVLSKNAIRNDRIIFTGDRPTGFMLKSLTRQGDPDIFYYRKGSAASTLSEQDVLSLPFNEYTHLHLTGILPALTEQTRSAAYMLLRLAEENGLVVTFDPNLRPQLWESHETMIRVVNDIAARANIVMPGQGEGRILTGSDDPAEIARFYHRLGVRTVVVKLGAKGAYYSDGITAEFVPGFSVSKVVDTVGAGDGFAVGLISAMQEGKNIREAVLRGNAVGAIQVMSRGDNDGLPTRKELADFMQLSAL